MMRYEEKYCHSFWMVKFPKKKEKEKEKPKHTMYQKHFNLIEKKNPSN